MILTFLNIVLTVGTHFFSALGVPTVLPHVHAIINSGSLSTFISTFHSWLSWIFYFIPKGLIVTLIGCVLVLWILRIFMSLFRVITDLL